MPNTYKIDGLTLVFNDEDPQRTKESIHDFMQSLVNKIDKSNEQLESQVNMLRAYNKLTELCIDTRRFQDSAMQASKVNNGPLFAQNFTNARAKFKEVQAQVKHIQEKQLDKVPAATSGEIGKVLLETKKSGETFYKLTSNNSNEMIKHATFLKQLAEQHAAGKASPQVHPEPASSSSATTPLRTSAYDAKRIESKAKAENANKTAGSAAGLNNLNSAKK